MSEDGAPCDPYAHYAAEFVRTGLLGFLGPVRVRGSTNAT